jgi:4-hydroxythreonine-4-phosphate dehydrogenase
MRPLAITMGDASGVGPEILLRAFAAGELGDDVVAVGDRTILEHANARFGCGITLDSVDAATLAAWGTRAPGTRLRVIDLGRLSLDELRVGEISAASGAAALAYVERATRLAQAGQVSAVVTLPINKAATRVSAPGFTGHTEYIAALCGRSDSTLMLASEEAIVTHVSTHVSLRDALDLVRTARVLEVIGQTHEVLGRLRPQRRIGVAGLNPHAGEGGAFGDEDRLHIAPAVERARAQGISASGPHPPDTVFLDLASGRLDAVVCMYHDQGHIPMKLLDFKGGVNVTLGLPIVRTSVDHGTAFDIAWQGLAFTDSLRDACRMARRLGAAT